MGASGKQSEWREEVGAVQLFSVKIFSTTFSRDSQPYPSHPLPALAAPGAASPVSFSLAPSSPLQFLSMLLFRYSRLQISVWFIFLLCVHHIFVCFCGKFVWICGFSPFFLLMMQDAVEEVLQSVLRSPIRPHFAIACVRHKFGLERTHKFVCVLFVYASTNKCTQCTQFLKFGCRLLRNWALQLR